MILPCDFLDYSSSFGLIARLYLDGYTDAEGTTIYLPKRTYDSVRDPKRMPHLSFWTRYMHTSYLSVPKQMPLHQYVVLDDGWALTTLQLIVNKFSTAKEQAARVAFHMWERILFWQQYEVRGFVTTHQQTAEVCGCTEAFAIKVIGVMLDAGLIYRKWVGNNLGHFGTCYMPGREANVDKLLAENPI